MTNLPPSLRFIPEELIGERIVLRPRSPDNDHAVWEAIEESRDSLKPWLAWVNKCKSLEDCQASGRRALARWILREDLAVVIFHRETQRLLGCSGLLRINWDIPSFEIGYWLRDSAVGYGYATEAVKTLSQTAFETLEAKRVFMVINASNFKSLGIPQRAGFRQEATLRNETRDHHGSLCDKMIYAMTPEDYEATRTTIAER